MAEGQLRIRLLLRRESTGSVRQIADTLVGIGHGIELCDAEGAVWTIRHPAVNEVTVEQRVDDTQFAQGFPDIAFGD